MVTISKLHSYKNNKKITMITAYDALFAKIFDDIVDVILVGDSLNMSFVQIALQIYRASVPLRSK